MNQARKYAVVGTGGRSELYLQAIVEKYADSCRLVGLCDTNRSRMKFWLDRFKSKAGAAQAYAAQDFDRMIAEQRPDWVVVTTMDRFHDEYIVRAMELGCDVITEKPLTIDAARCQRILDTQKRTGRRVVVTFNYRYSPIRTMAKKVMQDGAVGEPRSVDFNWMLDRRHGADYFRRWHRNKVNSGGLLVHKATHHFDLVNWYLESAPEIVFATGSRGFYLPAQADRLGLKNRGGRCHGCPEAPSCAFFLDLAASPLHRGLYLESEQDDGYFRDRCVFSPEIDIEDRLSVSVRYRNGATMSYSLNAFMPYEGYRLTINGTAGRLEMYVNETSYTSGDGTVQGALLGNSFLRVYPLFDDPYEVEIPDSIGGHGGGDEPLLADVFALEPPEDPYKRAASHIDGANSILTGIAANRSIETGQPVQVESLVRF